MFADRLHSPHVNISGCPSFHSRWLCWILPDLQILFVWLITEQNWLQAWDTTARLKDCCCTNTEQKINSWINCWACLVDQSLAIIAARENGREHVCLICARRKTFLGFIKKKKNVPHYVLNSYFIHPFSNCLFLLKLLHHEENMRWINQRTSLSH